MKYSVLSTALAAMIVCGASVAMATGGCGCGGGGSGGGGTGGGSASSERDGSPGPDRDTEAASSSANEAYLAICDRMLTDRQIAQEGPYTVSEPTLEQPMDCNLPGEAEQN